MASRTIRRLVIRALRVPAVLYDWHLGWLLGRRLLRLTHRGRRSGRCYRMMLEVIVIDRTRGEVFVMVGLGRRAQWYRNVMADGAVEVAIGRRCFRPAYRELAPTEAAAVLGDYERRNRLLSPIVRAMLSGLTAGVTTAVRKRGAVLSVSGQFLPFELRPELRLACASSPGRL